MALTSTSDLYIVELLVYLVLLPITLYLGYRHGKAGFLGYFYLSAICAVRIAADTVSLLPVNRDANHPNMATAILSSIGLSPLLLALSGFLHESHVRLVHVTQGSKQAKTTKRWLWVMQIQIHGTSILGIVLAIIGTLKLESAQTTLTSEEINTDEKLRAAGAAILLVLWVLLLQYALYLSHVARNVRISSAGKIDCQQMVFWILFAMPYAGVRCISTVLYTFDHNDTNLNPITGALWIKVIFIVLATLGAVISLCISGWVSRDFPRNTTLTAHGSSNDIQYEAVRSLLKE